MTRYHNDNDHEMNDYSGDGNDGIDIIQNNQQQGTDSLLPLDVVSLTEIQSISMQCRKQQTGNTSIIEQQDDIERRQQEEERNVANSNIGMNNNVSSNDPKYLIGEGYKARRLRTNPNRKRFGARNNNRMKVLLKFIFYEFHETIFQPAKRDNPNKTIQILDVAGGKGELAARLSLCHNTNVIMIDPRPANILHVFHSIIFPKLPNKWQYSIRQKMENDSQFLENILKERYQQLEMYFDERTTQYPIIDNEIHSSTSIEDDVCHRSSTKPLSDDDDDDDNNSNDVNNHNNQQMIHNNKNKNNNMMMLHQAIQDCDIIIGMHSDSATECIVDVALRHNKPFIVLPCCVFPNLFQTRYVYMPTTTSTTSSLHQDSVLQSNNNGISLSTTFSSLSINNNKQQQPQQGMVRVRDYDQFCEYLLQKDHRFKKSILPFDGRNVAIWWDGKGK